MINQPQLTKDSVKLQRRLFKFMNSPAMQLFLIFLLMISLFLADSWICGNAPDSSNDAMYGILCFVLAAFTMESLVLSIVQDGYFLSFFFWMDVLGTVSIILDIGWIASAFLPQGVAVNGSILRATRAAKLGARYGRLMRLLKLMKFMRYLPCFAQKEDEKGEPTMTAVRRVSAQLSAALTQKVAALVMIIVIVVPFLGYSVIDYSAAAWAASTATFMTNEGNSITDTEMMTISNRIHRFYHAKDVLFLGMTIERELATPATADFETSYTTREVLRSSNIDYYKSHYTDANGMKRGIEIRLDNTEPNAQDAMFGIILILLVIGILFSFSASFHNAVDHFVVAPLEKTMNALRTSATVMLKSMKAMENEKKEEEKKDGKDGNGRGDRDDDYDELDGSEDGGETIESQMLEKMVEKLARIVKHMVPEEKIEIGGNVDASTAAWIAGTFQATTKEVEQEHHEHVDARTEKARLDSLSSKTLVSIEVLNTWRFDVLKFENDQLIDIFNYLFAVLNVFDDFKIPNKVFNDFMRELASRYINTNTYHNFKHGCDVAHTVYRIIFDSCLNIVMSRLEIFSMILAGLAHDVGHPGVNNPFLILSKHELALRYNDKSPLENMHASVLYEILGKAQTNILVGLTDKQWRESRKLIVTSILGTDMMHHQEQIGKARLFLEVNGEDTKSFSTMQKDTIDSMADEKNRIFILELILHCADISNPFKPFEICEAWALLVVEEFFSQGDREKQNGLPVSPMMDRATAVLCNMQMGFIEFAVAPLISTFVKIFPGLYEIVANMRDNFCAWGEKRKAEVQNDPNIPDKAECGKLDDRMKKFRESSAYCMDLQQLPKRTVTGKHH